MRIPRVGFRHDYSGQLTSLTSRSYPVDEDFQASSSDGGSDDSDADDDSAMSDASADKPAKKKQKTSD